MGRVGAGLDLFPQNQRPPHAAINIGTALLLLLSTTPNVQPWVRLQQRLPRLPGAYTCFGLLTPANALLLVAEETIKRSKFLLFF